MNCEKCKSPLNLVKAKRRYTKKYGWTPSGGFLGLCACGALVMDRDWFKHRAGLPVNS